MRSKFSPTLAFSQYSMELLMPCVFFSHHYFPILIVVDTILFQCCLQICYGIIMSMQLLLKTLEFSIQILFLPSMFKLHASRMWSLHQPCDDFELTLLNSLFFCLHHCLKLFNFLFQFWNLFSIFQTFFSVQPWVLLPSFADSHFFSLT